MIPDIKIRDYYERFINNIENDIIKYKDKLIELDKEKKGLIKYILENKDKFNEVFEINLDKYKEEIIDGNYHNNRLYSVVIRKYNSITDNPDKILLIQLIKYCNIIEKENRYNKFLNIVNVRKNIKLKTYKKLVTLYYNKVHQLVLEGYAYKFSNGIGYYNISLWCLDKNAFKYKSVLDYNETNKRKKELISKGIPLYNKEDAERCKELGIPYNGVEYKVYKTDRDYYEFKFVKSKLCADGNLEYKRTEYVNIKYKGISYTEMADKLCNSIEDIYNLQVDIRYKLNILLHKYPNKYLNFVRNDTRRKYKC